MEQSTTRALKEGTLKFDLQIATLVDVEFDVLRMIEFPIEKFWIGLGRIRRRIQCEMIESNLGLGPTLHSASSY